MARLFKLGTEAPTLARDRSNRRSPRGRSRPGANDWLDPEDHRRRDLRRWLVHSAIGHAVVLGLLVWSPGPAKPTLPGVVTVDLVAMGAAAAPGAATRAASAAPTPRPTPPSPSPPPARPVSAPQPVPAAPAKPAPPPPETPRREAALPKAPQPTEPKKPKQRAQPDPEPEPPLPKPVAKPDPPKPPPAAPPAPPPPRREEAYDDVLAQLRAERGEERPDRVDRQAVRVASAAGVPGASGTAGDAARGAGARIDAELAVWLRAAKLHVEHAWIMPPGFEREPLRTVVQVRLDAGGKVLGEPRIQQRSGNPWFDESVVRAIQKASPLPPPPDAGDWPFEFTPPGRPG